MTYATVAADVTGLESLNVLGNYASQIPLVWLTSGGSGSTGILLEESPAGSGTLTPVTTPVPLPQGGHLNLALAYNRAYMTDTDYTSGLAIPLVLDGPSGNLTPISQNAPGALWQPNWNYFEGDLVRTSVNPLRWFLATNTGVSGATEPVWPTLDGYFEGSTPEYAEASDGSTLIWQEWTPTVIDYVPAPEPPSAIISIKGQSGAPSGTISSGQDVYVSFSYENDYGSSVWTTPIVYENTAANDVLEIFFQAPGQVPGPTASPAYGAVGYGGPRMPGWMMAIRQSPGLQTENDPLIKWPIGNYLFVWVAGVSHGSAAPTEYQPYGSALAPTAPVIITSVPASSGGTFTGSTESVNQVPTNQGTIDSIIYQAANVGPNPDLGINLWVYYQRVDTGGPDTSLTNALLEAQAAGVTLFVTFANLPSPFSSLTGPYEVIAAPADASATPPGGSHSWWYFGVQIGGPPGNGGTGFTIPQSTSATYQWTYTTPSDGRLQETVPSGFLSNVDFQGNQGLRYLAVLRTDFNDSFSPIDPGAVLPVNCAGSLTEGIINMSLASSGTLTIYLGTLAGFQVGGIVSITGASNALFNVSGLTVVAINPSGGYGAGSIVVNTTMTGSSLSATGGTITQQFLGKAPVVIVPPGYNDAQDVAALTVAGNNNAGPFTYIPEAIPAQPFSTTVTSLSAANGAATILVTNPSGIAPGDGVILQGTGTAVDGVLEFVASVTGNSIVLADSTNTTASETNINATLAVAQIFPTAQVPFGSQIATISTISRQNNGLVTATVSDVRFLAPGMRIYCENTGAALVDGTIVQILNVLPSLTSNGGQVIWQTNDLGDAFTQNRGQMYGAPGILLNFDDNTLADSEDVTSQLGCIGAPKSIDVYYSHNLDRMVYTPSVNYGAQVSSHYFSNIGDPENVQNPNGILGVDQSNGYPTLCFREMANGQLFSIKGKGIYQITPSALPPSEWQVSIIWNEHEVCGPDAAKAASEFLIVFARGTGPHKYDGSSWQWIGHEKQGTWDKVNWDVMQEIQVEIDVDNKRVFFGVPLNGSTTVNYWEVLDYSMGWQDPLIVMLDGSTQPNRYARRWSEWPLAARKVKVVKRTLATPYNPLVDDRQTLFGLAATELSLSKSYIQMENPNVYQDDSTSGESAVGIDWQYLPAFARSKAGMQSPFARNTPPQTGVGIEAWEHVDGRARGNGYLTMTPTADDPTFAVTPSKVPTVPLTVVSPKVAGTPVKFAKSLGEPIERELLSINFNNAATAGTWAELQEMILWFREKYPMQPGEKSSV